MIVYRFQPGEDQECMQFFKSEPRMSANGRE